MRATVLLITGASQVMGAGLLLLWSYTGAPAPALPIYTPRFCAFFAGVALMNGLGFVARALNTLKDQRAARQLVGA